MNRRSFIKKTGFGSLALTTAGSTLGSLVPAAAISGEVKAPHLPPHITAWHENLYELIKVCRPSGSWDNLDHSASALAYTCVEKIPMQWTTVTTFDYRSDPPRVDEKPRTSYCYSNVDTSFGTLHIDFLRKWHYDPWPTGPSPREVMGTLAFISSGGVVLNRMRGQIFGSSYAMNPWGIRKNNWILDFDSDHNAVHMPDGHFYVWEDR